MKKLSLVLVLIFLFFTFFMSVNVYFKVANCKDNSGKVKTIKSRIETLQPKIDPLVSGIIAKSIFDNCDRYNLSENLVLHLIFRESSFNPMAVSSHGAKGLMQIMVGIHKKEIKELNDFNNYEIYHIDKNIRIGCIILKKYIRKSNDCLEKALKRYVGGNNRGYLSDIFRLMAEWEWQKRPE